MAQFTNQASVSYNGLTVASNIVTGEIAQALTLQKNAVVGTYRQGDVLTYVISLQNTGAVDYTGLSLSDDLGTYTQGTFTRTPLRYTGDTLLYYINGVLQPEPTVTAGPPLVVTGIDVPAGGNTVLVYRATANEFAPLGANGTILNTASVTGGGLAAAVTAEETVTAQSQPALTILKELNPITIVGNGPVTYTFTLRNSGATAADAAANVSITDIFSPALAEPLTVTLNGAAWDAAGNYTYDATTGLFSTTPGSLTVPAATFTQNPATGTWTTTPGETVVTVTGNLA